jgi:hypothetical protein
MVYDVLEVQGDRYTHRYTSNEGKLTEKEVALCFLSLRVCVCLRVCGCMCTRVYTCVHDVSVCARERVRARTRSHARAHTT